MHLTAVALFEVVAQQIEVTNVYAAKIRKGFSPHPRHWDKLAALIATADR